MPITSVHPLYADQQKRVRFTRDMCSDGIHIREQGSRYLPASFADSTKEDDQKRYTAYLKRAYFYGATGKTKRDMVGAAFRKPASSKLPSELESLLKNFDGAGNSIEAINKSGIDNLLEAGKHALLADYPVVEDGLTAEQEAAMNLMPYVSEYTSETIDNWKTDLIYGRTMLVMVKLVEWAKVVKDEFSFDTKKTFRVLRLRSPEEASAIFGGTFKDYVYTQALYDESEAVITPEYIPTMPTPGVRGSGTPFNFIPFFIGDVGKPPLMEIAEVNLAHYQTTADYRENLHQHGQMTIGIRSALSFEQFQTANPDGVSVGAMTGHFLGENGGFESVSAPESSSLDKALGDMQKQMETMGAKLMTEGAQKTAEEARLNASSQTSILDSVVSVWNDEVLTPALRACAMYKGVNPDLVSYTMNRDYYDTSINAQDAAAIVTLKDSGAIAVKDMRHMLRTGKIKLDPARTDEMIDADIASESI